MPPLFENAHHPITEHPDSWLDLLLYLGAVVLGFLGLSFGLSALFYESGMWVSVLAYGLNILVFVGVVYLLAIRRGKLSWASLGLVPPRWNWRWFPWLFGFTVVLMPLRGCVGMAVQYALEGDLTSLELRQQLFTSGGTSFLNFLVSFLLAGVLVPFAEELFFRGLIFTWFRRRYNLWWATLFSSVLFGLGHFDALGVVVASFFIGVVNALLYERTRSLWAPFVLHAINNSLAMLLVYLSLVAGSSLGL